MKAYRQYELEDFILINNIHFLKLGLFEYLLGLLSNYYTREK